MDRTPPGSLSGARLEHRLHQTHTDRGVHHRVANADELQYQHPWTGSGMFQRGGGEDVSSCGLHVVERTAKDMGHPSAILPRAEELEWRYETALGCSAVGWFVWLLAGHESRQARAVCAFVRLVQVVL